MNKSWNDWLAIDPLMRPVLARPRECYVDVEGVVWYRVDEDTVWSKQHGYGVWDNGRGLKCWRPRHDR